MVKEVLNDTDYEIDYSNEFKDGIIITTKSISDEQITELKNKIKAKYSSFNNKTNEENEDEHNHEENIISTIDVPNVNIYDLIKIYIKPIIITTIITLVFLAIIFRKSGIVKSVIIPIILILGLNALYISAIAILRIPVSEYIISIGIFVYAISLIITTLYTKKNKSEQEV